MLKIQDAAARPPMLIDQGTDDQFLETQLYPHLLEQAAKNVGYPLTLRRQPGYDRGYYFISSFIEDHLRHHGRMLIASNRKAKRDARRRDTLSREQFIGFRKADLWLNRSTCET